MADRPDIDAIAQEACATAPGNPEFAWQLAHRRLTKALAGRDDLDDAARKALREALDRSLERQAGKVEPVTDAAPSAPVRSAQQPPVTDQDLDRILADAFHAPFDGSWTRLDALEARARAALEHLFEDRGTGLPGRLKWRWRLAGKARSIRQAMLRDFPQA